MELAKNYLSESEIAVFKLGLSLRIYSARVEMFSQMAVNKNISSYECNNIVDIGGTFTCSLEDIDKLLDSSQIEQVCNLYNFYKYKIHNVYVLIIIFFRIHGKPQTPMT